MAIVQPTSAAPGKMTLSEQLILAATLVLAMAASGGKAMGQTAPSATRQQSTQRQGTPAPSASLTPEKLPLETLDPSLFLVAPGISCPPQPLLDFRDSDIKFKLEKLMNILRDSRHES